MEGYTMLGENFIDYTCHVFSEMRLMVEGAVQLYENEASILCSVAKDEEPEALTALNDIGTALYAFRHQVRQLQEAHRREMMRSANAQNPL
jgi:hypothetical protein